MPLYVLCHFHTSKSLRIMALVLDSICRCRHWGLEMPIPWSQSQSKELAEPGFELRSIWLWHQLCQMHSSHYFKVTTYGWEVLGLQWVLGLLPVFTALEGGGRDGDSTTRNTTQPLQVYICCWPGSEILPFFTCHNPICCVGQIQWLSFLEAFSNTVR